MSENKNDRFTIGVIAVILILFSLVDFFAKYGLLGEKSIPKLSESAEYHWADMQSGRFFQDYEKWEEQNFYNRSKWEKIMQDARVFLGQREVKGIYLGKDGILFEKHSPEEYSEEAVVDSLVEVSHLTQAYNARILLLPTSDEIWKKKLPGYVEVFDQKAYLERVREVAGGYYVPAYETLWAHSGEKIYYYSDSHLTSLAAYYLYHALCNKLGKVPYYYDLGKTVTVTKGYVGEFGTRTGNDRIGEEIFAFSETYRNPVSVILDGEVEKEGYYRLDGLIGENAYDYFLGNDFGIAQIETGKDRSRSLFVVGDSNAGCIIPLIAPHYKRVIIVNKELFQGNLDVLMKYYQDEGNVDFLLLQSVPDYIRQF